MHSENTLVDIVVSLLLWRWALWNICSSSIVRRQAKNSREVWFFIDGWGCWNIQNSSSAVYGEIYLTSVHEGQRKFRDGRTSLQDDLQLVQVHRDIMPKKINESQRKKFVFRSALAMALCMPLWKITFSCKNFACKGFHINWWRDKRLKVWLHVWVNCSGVTRKSMTYCYLSSHGDKTCSSPRAKITMQTPQFSCVEEIQSCPSTFRWSRDDHLIRLQGPSACQLPRAWSHNKREALWRHAAETATHHKVKKPWNSVWQNHSFAE